MKIVELEITDATQYATAYVDGKPIATVRRRHAFDPEDAPRWQAWAVNGELLFNQRFGGVRTLTRRINDFANRTGMFRDWDHRAQMEG